MSHIPQIAAVLPQIAMLRRHSARAVPRIAIALLQIAAALLLFASTAAADTLPEALGTFTRGKLEPYQPESIEIFREFGFEEGERAVYFTPEAQQIEVSAVRFRDATGAFAAYQWVRPANGESVPHGAQAVRLGDLTVIQFGNYLVRMQGALPVAEHVEAMLGFLPRMQITPTPPLLGFVPPGQLVAGSQRHILGPLALREVAPEIPPSVAAFHFGTEAQALRYESPAGEMRMVLFSYPSPQIARGQIEEFQKLSGIIAKRSGPLIAAVISPASPDEAQLLLAKVQYAVEVTPTPHEVGRHDNLGTLIWDIVLLCAVLIVLMIVGGAIVAGSRILARRYVPNSLFAANDGPDMVRLDIDNRRPGSDS
jgi:hypothetical protein